MTNIKNFFGDCLAMLGRCLKLNFRNIESVVTTIMLPAIMLVMFVNLFGGALNVGDISYINYVVPGIIVLTIGQTASSTAVSVNNDVSKGVVDRFLSMPTSRTAFLIGHVLASLVRNIIATSIIIGLAFVMGFRPEAGFGSWVVVLVLLVAFMLVMTWLSVFVGLSVKTPEGAGVGLIAAMLLPYISSGFVPTDTMPTVLRVIAERQPMTPIIDTLRSLFLFGQVGNQIWVAAAWVVILVIVGYAASILMFRRRVTK